MVTDSKTQVAFITHVFVACCHSIQGIRRPFTILYHEKISAPRHVG